MAAATVTDSPVVHHTHERVREPRFVGLRAGFDRLLGSDPGNGRLRVASKATLTIGLALLAEWIFVRGTGALKLTAGPPQVLAVQHHGVTVIAMLLGAMVGMLSAFAVSDPKPRGQLITMLFLPVPMMATMTLGLWLGGHRTPALIGLVALITVGTYLRRFGPRGFLAGATLFMGGFLGFFLRTEIPLRQVGWLIAELGIGLAVALIVNFVLFYPRPQRQLLRLRRSWSARARRAITLADAIVASPSHRPVADRERDARRLHRQLVRLTEATLMIDAQLGDAGSVPRGATAARMHARLFDLELALTNTVRFAEALAARTLSHERREQVRGILRALDAGDAATAGALAQELRSSVRGTVSTQARRIDDTEVVLLHRFATTTVDLVAAREAWHALDDEMADDVLVEAFVPAVNLFAGWLPGSTLVSAQASIRRGLPPYVRTAIQMGVATSLATVLGSLLSERRFYWALIAAFVSFMAANNSVEQARKAVLRVGGTVAGIFLGGLLAHAVADRTALAITTILVALFLGFYLMRISYGFFVIGITVMVSQMYVQLGEYSDELLVTRLEETAIGAACAVATVLLVLPLRGRHVIAVAAEGHLRAVAEAASVAAEVMCCRRTTVDLLPAVRAVDATWHALVTTAKPLRGNRLGRYSERLEALMGVSERARYYVRNLLPDLDGWPGVPPGFGDDLARGSRVLASSVDALAGGLASPRGVTYTRSAGLFDRLSRELESSRSPGPLALRDLQLLDGALAGLAGLLGMDVTDFDTCAA